MKLAQMIFLMFFCSYGRALATLVLVEFFTDRVIVVADSREAPVNTIPPRAIISDHACKISEIDPHVFFFATGNTTVLDSRTFREIWDSNHIARDAFIEYGDFRGNGFVRYMATWAEMIRQRYYGDFQTNPQWFISQPRHLSAGVFGRSDEHGIRIYIVDMSKALPPELPVPTIYSSTREIYPGDQPIFKFGSPFAFEFANEFLANETSRAKALNAKFREIFTDPNSKDFEVHRLISAVTAAIDWIPDKTIIGGSVDAIVAERGKDIRWISQKSECSKENTKAKQSFQHPTSAPKTRRIIKSVPGSKIN